MWHLAPPSLPKIQTPPPSKPFPRNADDIGGTDCTQNSETRGNLAQAAHLIRPRNVEYKIMIKGLAGVWRGQGENNGVTHTNTYIYTRTHTHTILLTNDLQNILLSCRHMHGAQVSPWGEGHHLASPYTKKKKKNQKKMGNDFSFFICSYAHLMWRFSFDSNELAWTNIY